MVLRTATVEVPGATGPDRRGPDRVVLGGCTVDLLDRDAVLERLRTAVRTRSPLAIASANLDHVHHFGQWGPQRAVFESGAVPWTTLLDGAPLAVRARQISGRDCPRQAGSDLLGPVVDLADREGWRVGFLGGAPQMHAQLRDTLARNRPGLRVTGCWAPDRSELEDEAAAARLADEVARAGTDVLVVGLGKPRQELWIERYGRRSGAPLLLAFGAATDMLAFGAATDMLAGSVTRAPC